MQLAGSRASPRSSTLGPRPVARCARSPQSGFTLLEAVLSAALVGFLAVTATFFWVENFTLVRTVNSDSAAISDGRALLERLAREIREIKYDAANGAYCVSTMTATQMVFNKTSDTAVSACGGANPTNNDVAVSIQVSGSNLNLGYAGTAASPVATRSMTGYVSSFSIRYLDSSYAATASAAALCFVELTLTLQPTGVQATPLRTVVALRNS